MIANSLWKLTWEGVIKSSRSTNLKAPLKLAIYITNLNITRQPTIHGVSLRILVFVSDSATVSVKLVLSCLLGGAQSEQKLLRTLLLMMTTGKPIPTLWYVLSLRRYIQIWYKRIGVVKRVQNRFAGTSFTRPTSRF